MVEPDFAPHLIVEVAMSLLTASALIVLHRQLAQSPAPNYSRRMSSLGSGVACWQMGFSRRSDIVCIASQECPRRLTLGLLRSVCSTRRGLLRGRQVADW